MSDLAMEIISSILLFYCDVRSQKHWAEHHGNQLKLPSGPPHRLLADLLPHSLRLFEDNPFIPKHINSPWSDQFNKPNFLQEKIDSVFQQSQPNPST